VLELLQTQLRTYFVGEESADEAGESKEPVSKKETEASKKSDKKNK